MKKIVFGFWVVLLPMNLFAADHCTNPDEYTIDRRCYVAGDWSKEPYKHVLKMGYRSGNPKCTANMVAGKIVTAKHCVLGKDLNNIKFTAFDGTDIYVQTEFDAGSYDEIYEEANGEKKPKETINADGDWAVLTPKQEYQKFVIDNSIFHVNAESSEPWTYKNNDISGVDFMIIGCGGLKIMSDQEIENFRRAYVDYLYDEGVYSTTKDVKYKRDGKYPIDWNEELRERKSETFEKIGTVDIGDKSWGQKFLLWGAKYMKKYGLDGWGLTVDMDSNKLKVSHCLDKWDKSKWNKNQGCQTWGGDSGGGLYSFWKAPLLTETEFLGVHTRGCGRYIGNRQAASKDNIPVQFFMHKLPDANKY